MVKVERSFPAPASLAIESQKVNGRYNCDDVVMQLIHDFHDKCYLCEISPLQDPQVEHLLPHKNGRYPERKFDWNNLFWSCGHCNSMKNKAKYDDGIIDCCTADPEEIMSFDFKGKEVNIEAVEAEEPIVQRTVELLNEVYNNENTGMRKHNCALRVRALCEEMDVFYHTLEEYTRNRQDRVTVRSLKALLSRQSRFAAFKRYYIRNHSNSFPELLPLVDR